MPLPLLSAIFPCASVEGYKDKEKVSFSKYFVRDYRSRDKEILFQYWVFTMKEAHQGGTQSRNHHADFFHFHAFTQWEENSGFHAISQKLGWKWVVSRNHAGKIYFSRIHAEI